MVGYTGGKNPRPTYDSVCDGDGHTEAIKVEYDPSKVNYEDLLDVFYKGCRAESGGKTQYKSAIWVHNPEQRTVAEEVAKQHGKQGRLQIMDEQPWHDAEDYHQKYYKKNGCCLQ